MKLILTKKTITIFLVGLILMLNFQCYFSSDSFESYSTKKHYTNASHNASKNDLSIASIVDEDETSETELSVDYFAINFSYNPSNTALNLIKSNNLGINFSSDYHISKPIYIRIQQLLI